METDFDRWNDINKATDAADEDARLYFREVRRNAVPTTWLSSCANSAARLPRRERKEPERSSEYDCPCFWSYQGVPSAQPA